MVEASNQEKELFQNGIEAFKNQKFAEATFWFHQIKSYATCVANNQNVDLAANMLAKGSGDKWECISSFLGLVNGKFSINAKWENVVKLCTFHRKETVLFKSIDENKLKEMIARKWKVEWIVKFLHCSEKLIRKYLE